MSDKHVVVHFTGEVGTGEHLFRVVSESTYHDTPGFSVSLGATLVLHVQRGRVVVLTALRREHAVELRDLLSAAIDATPLPTGMPA